jgi:DNA repair protein RecN (Recombination protein N)
MLKHLTLKDFVIVTALEVEFSPGFSVLTGETGAGKSILIDALQLALGARGDAGVVREGAARADISAGFDTPASLRVWLEENGLDAEGELLLRRVVDAQGKSRAYINGSAATLTQLREVAEHLIDIHGQHAWQGLTRPASVRALLDEQAGLDLRPLASAYNAWRAAASALQNAQTRQTELDSERERLLWQLGELERLSPGDAEWEALNTEHQRLAHGQALLSGVSRAQQGLDEDEHSAARQLRRALSALEEVQPYDARLAPMIEELHGALAQLDDATRALSAYLARAELDPARLAELDARLSAWVGLARRFRRPAPELPALLAETRAALRAAEAAADLAGLEQQLAQTRNAWQEEADRISTARHQAAGPLAQRVTEAMQLLGMAGGRFEVLLQPHTEPQAYGQETVEFLVAGHAGSAPRPLAKVASGGELSRLALAIAVTTAQARQASAQNATNAANAAADGTALPPQESLPNAATLIFDEIDSGVGGTVADAVGRLMRQLGHSAQVLAVTHLPQVAACADQHFVVAKALQDDGRTHSRISPVSGAARVQEIARMLGGERHGTSLAHAQALMEQA